MKACRVFEGIRATEIVLKDSVDWTDHGLGHIVD